MNTLYNACDYCGVVRIESQRQDRYNPPKGRWVSTLISMRTMGAIRTFCSIEHRDKWLAEQGANFHLNEQPKPPVEFEDEDE